MKKIMVLPGDGIGPEIVNETLKVMDFFIEKSNLEISYDFGDIGGIAIDKYGIPLKDETLEMCKNSDAVLLGAVGGPKWETTEPGKPRPEDALLKVRKEMSLFANLRPVKIYKSLIDSSTLKKEVIEGVDILVLRELTGGIYFGKRERIIADDDVFAYDTELYHLYEIERIVKLAFETARLRRKKVTSVDKANILESSRLWRETVNRIHKNYSDIELNHMYVDNTSMQLIRNPKQFDVIVTSNMFGDILSDETAMISGSIGLLPSASLGDNNSGMYEPIHGSAPDIQGTGKANPIAQILSLAMLFRYSLGFKKEADIIEIAVEKVLEKGYRTPDIYAAKGQLVNTKEIGGLIMDEIKEAI
ncbi:MAG: 3-isopropylmalate dehydrogenase [Actinomycetota bacterium]|nr:3-isopropylmalate dehydrogenase [Actinomycetota bacterium]